jgi:hypothetical protein
MKKTSVYIILSVVLIALYFFTRKKPYQEFTTENSINPNPNANDIPSAFQELKRNFGPEFAKRMEQLFRYETRHFESKQFLEGYSPGMVATKTTYPFGWASLDEFNRANSIDGNRYAVGRVFVVNGENFRYVKFPDFETSLNFVAWFIRNKRGGVVQKWNSLNEATAQRYFNVLKTITTQFT